MNLWFRLIWLLSTAWLRPAIVEPTAPCDLRLRVLPTDLDLSRHLNNGRYLTLMDLGRLDYLLRSSLFAVVRREKLTPMVVGIAIRYRREIRPFQPYILRTKIVGWRETTVVFDQSFIALGGKREGQVLARALVRAGLYNRAEKRFETISDLMGAVGVTADAPPLPSDVEAFLAAENEMQIIDRGARQQVTSR